MKVSVYKNEDGTMSVLVQASPGKGRSPVLLSGVTPENVVQMVRQVVDGMRLPKGEVTERTRT